MPTKITECFWCSGCEAWGDCSPCQECGEEAQEVCFFCGHNVEGCDCAAGAVS